MPSFFLLSSPNLQMCLWSCLPDSLFFSPSFPQQLKLQIGAARLFSSFLFLHRSCLCVLLLLHTVCGVQRPTGGLNPLSLPRQRLQDRRCAQKQRGRQRSAWRFVVTLVRFFCEEKREEGRERERGRSVGLQLLLPSPDSSLRIAPFFTHCLLFFFFFF